MPASALVRSTAFNPHTTPLSRGQVCLLGASDDEPWPPYSTPLHLAAANGDERMVWALLETAAADPQPEVEEARKYEDYRGGFDRLFELFGPAQ